jgi:hypothetical protein
LERKGICIYLPNMHESREDVSKDGDSRAGLNTLHNGRRQMQRREFPQDRLYPTITDRVSRVRVRRDATD